MDSQLNTPPTVQMSNINSLTEQPSNGKATATTFSEQLDNGSNDDDSRSARRSRRTPKKFGNFYSVGENDEEFEEDLADDSDEDPSWDDKKGEEFAPKQPDFDSDSEKKKKMKKTQGSPPPVTSKQKQAPRQFAHPQMAVQAPQVWFTHEELARRAYQLAQQSPKLMESGLPAAINTINPQLLTPQQQQQLHAMKMQQAAQQQVAQQQASQHRQQQMQLQHQRQQQQLQQQQRMNPGFTPMSIPTASPQLTSNNASISSLVHSAQQQDHTSIHGLNNPLQSSNLLPKVPPPANLLNQLTPQQKQQLLMQHQLQQKMQSGMQPGMQPGMHPGMQPGMQPNPNTAFTQQNMISQQLALQRLAQLQQAAQHIKPGSSPMQQSPFGNPGNASINSLLNPNTSSSLSELPPRDTIIKLSDLPDLTVVADFPSGNGSNNIPPPKLATSPSPSSVKSISDLINQPTLSSQPSFGNVNSMTSNSAVPVRNILNPATPVMRSPYQTPQHNQMPQGLPFMSPFRGMERPGESPNWMFQNIQMNQPPKQMMMQQQHRPSPMPVVRAPPPMPQHIAHRPTPKGRPTKKKKLPGESSEESEFSSEESEPEQYGTEDDPQVKTLMNIMKQCEQYSNQIREILKQWQVQQVQEQAQPQNAFAPNFQNTYPFQIQPPAPAPPPPQPQTPHLELIQQPEFLKCELRSYQLVGLNWLYLVFQQKINAILADEMGLGKTVQTISLFALLKQRGETKKPHLVIAPATALENWVRELNMWCPSLSVFMYHGSAKDRETLRKKLINKDGQPIAEFDVLITTYNLCINKTDRVKLFKKFQFCYIVLDEAHNIKNVSSARYQSLFKLAFRAEHRLMLTGTPLQNNVNELWALLSFLMPNIFSATKDFKSLVWPEENPDAETKGVPKPGQLAPDYTEQVRRLKTILSPFLLRRLKSEVLGKLPPKTEKIRWCDLTEFQKNIYLRTYQMSRTKYHQMSDQNVPEAEIKKESTEIKKEGEEEDKDTNEKETTENINENEAEGSLNHILMQLRKAANNSLLFRNLYTDDDVLEIEAIMKEAEVKEEELKAAEQAALLKAKEEAAAQAAQAEEMKVEETPATEQPENEEKEPQPQEPASPKLKQEAPAKRQTRGKAAPPVVEEIIPEEPPEDEDCALCGEPGNLLYCDGPCNRAFHLPCVNLTEVPDTDKWFCEDCTKANNNGAAKDNNKESDKQAANLDNWDDVKSHLNEICKMIEASADPKGRSRSELFIDLPDREDYPDYYKLIKKPVCLSQIKERVTDVYTTVEVFRDDFLQMFTNAKTYNVAKSLIYRDAQFMEKQFRDAMSTSFPSINLPAEKVEKPEKPTKERSSPKASPKTPTTRKRKAAPKESPATDDSLSFDEFSDEEGSDDEGPPRKGRRGSNTVGRNTRNSRASAFAVDLGIRRSSRNKRSRRSEDEEDDQNVNMETSFNDDQDNNNNNKPKRQTKGRRPRLEEPFYSCRDVIEDLMEQDLSAPFNEPVDPVKLNLPNYLKIVKQPMDLGTVLKKLNNNEYSNTDVFVEDVRLVFDNCLKFNEAQSDIGMAAQTLWRYFKNQCKKNSIEVKEVAKRNSKKGYKVAEELRTMSDFQIHSYCKQHQKYLSKFLIPNEKFYTSSGKIVSLKKKLESLKRKDSRVIIFSQFTAVLDILEDLMSRMGYKYLRLDGQTPVLDRQQLIDEYNTNREIFVFLLSTRAGGIGINLTSANICIFHDIDWNPEMDRQAEARIHRIGQTKPVTIIKLLSKDSVDEYIQKMADTKKERNDLVMGEAKPGLVSDAEAKFSIGKVLASIFGSK